MVEHYDPNADGDAETDLLMLKPTKYVIGDLETEGHTHIFYLRDNLPIATTLGNTDTVESHHAHSIEEGPDGTVICREAEGHTHTNLVVEEAGDYTIRTLFVG